MGKERGGVQTLIGLCLVLLITFSWTGATQFSKNAYQNTTVFNSPFFLVYFSTSWMAVCYPLFLLTQVLGISCGLLTKDDFTASVKDSKAVFGPNGPTLAAFFSRMAFFILFWFIANYSYSRALSYISPSDVTAIFSSNLAFVYLLALCILKDRIFAIKVLAILMSIAGIVMMAYQEGFNGVGLLGVALVVLSSLAAAVYKVVFKRVVGDASFGQVSLFVSGIGAVNAVLVWPVMLGLALGGVELVRWNLIPWETVCAQAVLGLCFNYLVNLGLAVTNPLFVSIAIFLGYPMNALVDVIFRHKVMGAFEIGGSVLIVLGFALMLLPDDSGHRLWLAVGNGDDEDEDDDDDTSSATVLPPKLSRSS